MGPHKSIATRYRCYLYHKNCP